MGCVSSKQHLSENHPNIFNVMNVNENGQIISPGQLEVTETELIFYVKGKPPTKWSYSFLRKYGCDSDLFTIECGRRCPTGQGIYAFRCRKAEQLFNLLQRYLNVNPSIASLLPANGTIHIEPTVSTGPPVHRRVSSQPEGYLNPISNPVFTRPPNPPLSRPGSMNSNGPVSPSAISPPQSANDIAFEHNNNKRGSLVPEQNYTNASIFADADVSYINVNTVASPTLPTEHYMNLTDATSPVYMNVSACETPNLTKDMPVPSIETELQESYYANICPADFEYQRSLLSTNDSAPQTPTTNAATHEINYIQLDLESSTSSASKTKSNVLQKPSSPDKTKSYVTIDFLKSNALSQSINNRIEPEDGSRKTRHNASITEASSAGKHRSSLSD